ncbi:DUF3006 domain-containing protein [Paludisphaera rhizosphaerae]|uniref:DUF3006 domain-containing protein n=1 Tax=Paludisphaera rhizosphaerae TaxID=2711216 RepID=UPI0013EA0D7F|nr:DUF3006 domain-containing protein [Paludisphaera rhizosphaerae]
MPVQLSVDRFEGDLAVLATEDGASIDVPRAWLPEGAKPGDVLTLSLQRDDAATAKLAADTKKVQDELKATDPGGDITL